jgi:hypothetical protein
LWRVFSWFCILWYEVVYYNCNEQARCNCLYNSCGFSNQVCCEAKLTKIYTNCGGNCVTVMMDVMGVKMMVNEWRWMNNGGINGKWWWR